MAMAMAVAMSLTVVKGLIVCDDVNVNCNAITSVSFVDVDSVTFDYISSGVTTVGGVDYDVVIRWQPEVGAQITHSWTVVAQSRRVDFDCDNSRMYFNGIIIDATPGFVPPRNRVPLCTFNMQNGVLTSAYLDDPGATVFFLFSSVTGNGNDIYIDKNFDNPILPSDTFNPIANDPTMVCLDPDGPACNPVNSIPFSGGVTSVTFEYPAATSTVATDDVDYDVVVQWTPDVGTPITSTWGFEPNRRRNPFDCTNTKAWFNGTIVGTTSKLNGNTPYCTFDIEDGILTQEYIDAPERTIFFLFSGTTDVGDDIIITENYDKPLVPFGFYVPPNLVDIPVCDDQGGSECNVMLDVSFADAINPVALAYDNTLGTTLSGGVTYESAIKWLASPSETLTYSFEIYPDRNRDPFDCSGARLWVNGSIFTATTYTDRTPEYCVFDIFDGVLPQAVIDDPYNQIYFLFNNLIDAGDDFFITRNFKPPVSIENFSPVNLDSYVCDDPSGPNCNVISTISFVDDSAPVAVVYGTPGPTIVGGVTYDSVIKWVADPTEVLTYSWEVYPDNRRDDFDCSEAKVWVNGTIVGATSYLRGDNNNEPYCIFDINDGVLTQAIINDPNDLVYFLFSTASAPLLDLGDDYFIAKNFNTPVVSIESIVFFKFQVESYSIASNAAVGSTLTFDVGPRVYTSTAWPGPDTVCNSMPTIMGSLSVGSCTLSPETSDDVNGVYTYDFPKTLYDYCANGRETSGNDYIYTVVVSVPNTVGSCNYFEPPIDSRTSIIEIRTNQIDPGDAPATPEVSTSLLNYTIIPCSSLEYIVPQAKAKFVVNFTYTGNQIELAKTPYLDIVEDVLNVVSTDCTTFFDGTPNTCIYEFESSTCKSLLDVTTGVGDQCAFDSSSSKTLYDLDVTQIIDDVNQISATTEIPVVGTPLNLITFSGDVCLIGDASGPAPVNVTEQYEGVLSVRNRPYPNWETAPTRLNFYDDIIVQVNIAGSNAGGATEIHIKTVEFDISNPLTGERINKYTFNRKDKVNLHNNEWMRYYDDVHFCKFEYLDGTCEKYYELGSDRVNPFTEANVLPQLFDVCQDDFNATLNDHFSFSPSKWFMGITLPSVDIKLSVHSEIVDCVAGTERRLGAGEADVASQYRFTSMRQLATADTGTTRRLRPTRVIESDALGGPATSVSDTVLIVGLAALLVGTCFFAIKHHTDDDYGPIHK